MHSPRVSFKIALTLNVDGTKYEAEHVYVPGIYTVEDASVFHSLNKAARDLGAPEALEGTEPNEGEVIATEVLRKWRHYIETPGTPNMSEMHRHLNVVPQSGGPFRGTLEELFRVLQDKRRKAWADARAAEAKQPALPGVSK